MNSRSEFVSRSTWKRKASYKNDEEQTTNNSTNRQINKTRKTNKKTNHTQKNEHQKFTSNRHLYLMYKLRVCTK